MCAVRPNPEVFGHRESPSSELKQFSILAVSGQDRSVSVWKTLVLKPRLSGRPL